MGAVFATSRTFNVRSLSDLVQRIEPIQSDETVQSLLDRFDGATQLTAVPVRDEGHTFVIARRTFLSYFSRGYAKELFYRKSLRELLAHAPHLGKMPLCPNLDARVDQVVRDLLSHDPELQLEAIPVQDKGDILGIVPVADLLLAVSESQEHLIDALQVLSQRLRNEVEHAALLQRTLLPAPDFNLAGLRGYAHLLTSSEVGGDYYDYFAVGRDRVVLLIGDVSGHGVASGTMVSAAKAGANLLARENVFAPQEILQRLNEMLLGTARQSLLMTLFCASVDTRRGILHFANAGHQFPYLYRIAENAWSMLEAGGLPLGKNADAAYAAASLEIEPGDRVLLYTDGIVEAESPSGEPFGYERLEYLLQKHAKMEPAEMAEVLLHALQNHCQTTSFSDDVTIFIIDYQERSVGIVEYGAGSQGPLSQEVVRIVESFYRASSAPISSRIAKQSLILLTDGPFTDLLPRLYQDGIRRILPRLQPFLKEIGWERLFLQHQARPFQIDDLFILVPELTAHRTFEIKESADKAFILAEAEAWLAEQGTVSSEHLDAVVLLMDEMLENGLYAAPRDGQGRPLFAKAQPRVLAAHEQLRLDLALGPSCLGLAITDNWGTLLPQIFMHRLLRHQAGQGLEAGVGGAGLFFMWRMADYLQLRVYPQQRTQITALLDLRTLPNPEFDKGLQFFYHSEVSEVPSHA